MNLRDLLKEYWPIVAGVFAVILTAILLWPSDDSDSEEPTPEVARVQRLTDKAKKFFESERARENLDQQGDLEPAGDEPSRKDRGVAASSDSGMQMLEIVEAVPIAAEPGPPQTFETNDPEVQKALGQVKVVFYQEEDCDACKSARSFLEANQVPLSVVAVDDDSGQRERARRLSGQRSFPVIVVDGHVLTGFSKDSLQGALTSAVKKRVAAQN